LTAFAVIGAFWLLYGLPSVEALPEHLNMPSMRITDRNGRLLYEVLQGDAGRHTVVPFASIPKALRQATIATEDRSFYQNPGVDLRGILRAVWINLGGGETVAGGSTITQQVARNLLLTSPERGQRTLRRKLREAILAWQLSRRYTKDEILSYYLNQTYYGGLAYGVEAAAQTYFGRSVSELDLAECALIAGIPQAPALYNPFTDFEAAQKRQSTVLGLMVAAGSITPEEESLAEREPLRLASTPYPMEAPHFVMMVRNRLDALFTPEALYASGGLVVRTTLDLDWQKIAERAILRQIDELKTSEDGLGHNVNNAALVAMDPRTGEVYALVGNPDYYDAQHAGAVNMAISPRQPGSAIKPIVYAAAFDPTQPAPWSAGTMILDVHTSFVTHDNRAYSPENYDRQEHGPVLARQALASSLNIPAVITLDHIGLDRFARLAASLGITTLEDPAQYDLSLALGGGAVRLIELTAAYGAFANTGYRVTPGIILDITNAAGERVYTAPSMQKQRVLDARVAWLISDILSDDDARRLGFGANSLLRIDRPAAVKTGTTSNFHDNWAVGYTPDLVVGVWAGNSTYEAMREVTGLTGAAPIWHDFMRLVLAGKPERSFERPDGMVQVEICTLSGLLPTDACPFRRLEWYISGTQPATSDTFYRLVTIDAATNRLADGGTPPGQRLTRVALDLPLAAYPWARSQGLMLYPDLLRKEDASYSDPGASSAATQAPIRMVSPPAQAIYRFAPDYAAQAQQIRLEAVGISSLQSVTLWVDGVKLAELSAAPYQTWWPLAVGQHEAWAEAVLSDGTFASSERVSFEVK
jgi:1A family penicillin-binding protein